MTALPVDPELLRAATKAARTATKGIDPALREYLDQLVPSPAGIEGRRAAMMEALRSRGEIRGLPNDVGTEDLIVAGSIPVRLYTPSQNAAMILVYLHGGGWVAGSIETHDPFCRLLSAAAGVRIASVEYRLAPEHPFPAPLEDSLKVVEWARDLGGPVALGGDSAGGNLAAVVAGKVDYLQALLLLYPVTDHPSANHPSYTENANGYGLSADLMRWMWTQYTQDASPDNPEISPLRAENLSALPQTFVATAEYDVLRDEGLAYVQKLSSAGVAVTHLHAPYMNHNFAVHPGTVARFPQSQKALEEIAAWLRSIPARTSSVT